MWPESSSVSTVNLEKKLLQFQRYRIFPRGYFFYGAPWNSAFDVLYTKRIHMLWLRRVGRMPRNTTWASFDAQSQTLVTWNWPLHGFWWNGKMVNGSRYYRALESVCIASALSSALTILSMPDSIPRTQSKLQLPTARKKWWPDTADSLAPGG